MQSQVYRDLEKDKTINEDEEYKQRFFTNRWIFNNFKYCT